MLRPTLLDNRIAGLRQLERLGHLLKRTLVVGTLKMILGERRIAHDVIRYESARRLHTAIQVNSRNQSFYGVGEQSLLFPPSAQFLTASEEQILTQSNAQRNFMQVRGAH